MCGLDVKKISNILAPTESNKYYERIIELKKKFSDLLPESISLYLYKIHYKNEYEKINSSYYKNKEEREYRESLSWACNRVNNNVNSYTIPTQPSFFENYNSRMIREDMNEKVWKRRAGY